MGRKHKTGKKTHQELEPSVVASTVEIMKELGVGPEEWDILIIGDGSGTGWSCSCGWASVLIDRRSRLRKDLHGAMNFGTSYLAELIPYVQALSWYVEGPGKQLLLEKLAVSASARVKIHVVTDNELLVKQGTGKASRRKGECYWHMFDAFEARGFEVYWHWMRRSRLGLNRLSDYLAGLCRKSIDVITALGPPGDYTIYDFNPDPPG